MKRESGAALILMSIFILMAFISLKVSSSYEGYGGVIMIGPIPIIFGSSPEIALILVVTTLALIVISFLLLKQSLYPGALLRNAERKMRGLI